MEPFSPNLIREPIFFQNLIWTRAIVPNPFWNAAKIMKGMKMTDEEVFKTLRGKEFDIEHATEGKDDEEAVDSLG